MYFIENTIVILGINILYSAPEHNKAASSLGLWRHQNTL